MSPCRRGRGDVEAGVLDPMVMSAQRADIGGVGRPERPVDVDVGGPVPVEGSGGPKPGSSASSRLPPSAVLIGARPAAVGEHDQHDGCPLVQPELDPVELAERGPDVLLGAHPLSTDSSRPGSSAGLSAKGVRVLPAVGDAPIARPTPSPTNSRSVDPARFEVARIARQWPANVRSDRRCHAAITSRSSRALVVNNRLPARSHDASTKAARRPANSASTGRRVLLMTRDENVATTISHDEKPNYPGNLAWQVSGAQPQTPWGRPEPCLLQCHPEG